MPSPIRIGFVGLSSSGWAAMALAPPLLSAPLNEKYTLAAVLTSRPESAKATADVFSEKTGQAVKAYHGDTSAIASDPDVDLVVVAVKTPAHKAALVPALEKKKDVFVEWPLGKNLEEALELASLAKQAGVRTMIGLQAWQAPLTTTVRQIDSFAIRFAGSYAIVQVRNWIAEGKIGRVLSVSYIGAKVWQSSLFVETKLSSFLACRNAILCSASSGPGCLHQRPCERYA